MHFVKTTNTLLFDSSEQVLIHVVKLSTSVLIG